jgi:hypothetical protein
VPPAALYALPLSCKAFRSRSASSVCELRHGGRRCNLHATRKNSVKTCAAAVNGAAGSVFEARTGSVTVGNSYSPFPRVASPGARPRIEFRSRLLRALCFIARDRDPAVRFEKCMHACGAHRASTATKCGASSWIRSLPSQSTLPRFRQVRRSDRRRWFLHALAPRCGVDAVDTSPAKTSRSVHARDARLSFLSRALPNAA